MKKTIWSLAALIMFMAASVMTSCSNDDVVAPTEEVKSNVVTITIAPPAAEPESRVVMGGTTGLKITGWENGDEVILYKVVAENGSKIPIFPQYYSYLDGDGKTFTCVDAAAGVFSGDIGSDDIADYTLAVYGATAVEKGDKSRKKSYVILVPNTMCSNTLKDVVMMQAWKDNEGSYTMEIVNNVMKVNNGSGSDKVVAWSGKDYMNEGPYFFTPYIQFDAENEAWIPVMLDSYIVDYKGWANANPFTLPAGVDSYINMGICAHFSESWGLAEENGTEFLNRKQMNGSKYNVRGKLFNAGTVGAAPATTGTAKRTGDIDVNWVQLWENGPKFAEYNVGATSATDCGGYYTWGGSTDKDNTDNNTGSEVLSGDNDTATKLWGSNWRMPTLAELQDLLNKCNNEVITINGVQGRKFTGKDNYASNSVFFPFAGLFKNNTVTSTTYCFCWSSTPNNTDATYAYYILFNDQTHVDWRSYNRNSSYSVRAVLAEQ